MVANAIIAQYVKEMHKKHKLTQVDLSKKAGVGLRFVLMRIIKSSNTSFGVYACADGTSRS